MISVEEAELRIKAAIKPRPLEQIVITDGLGRVIGEDLISRRTQPPVAVSAMDGYAVRSADIINTPVVLNIVGTVPAGTSYDKSLNKGEAVRIFTGAPVPIGADAIVIQELTEQFDHQVRILKHAMEGTYIRKAGLDFFEGDRIMNVGTRLTVRHVGLAAAMNIPWLMVYRRPRVAILATGDEVVMPGDEIGPNQIVSSNAIALSSFVHAMGGEPVLLGIAPDDHIQLRLMMEGIDGNDMLVTTGGASVGDHDLVQTVLKERGMDIDFWRIAMRPGKPLMFGNIDGIPVLGLPGNPVSNLVCAMIFLRPALAKMQGIKETATLVSMKLGNDIDENDNRQDYLRATFETDSSNENFVRPFPKQDSSMLRMLTLSDGLIVRAPFAPAATRGSWVDVLQIPSGVFRI